MYKPLLKVALVGGAAAAALALGVGSASAAGTFTVTAGNAPTGTLLNFTGVTQGDDPQIVFSDVTSGIDLNCSSATAPGTITTGAGQAGTAIGNIRAVKTTWTGCTGPGGLTLGVTGVGVWRLTAAAGNANAVSGNITGIRADVADTVAGGSLCSFRVSGSVPVKYLNSAQTLTVTGGQAGAKLTISNVNGCLNAVANGDKAGFAAVYKVTANKASYNPLKITTP